MDTTEYGLTGFFILPRRSFRCKRDKLFFQDLVEMANYKDSPQCKKGQLIMSVVKYSEESGWSRDMIRYSLENLTKDGLILVEQNGNNRKHGLKITIINYDLMQNLSSYKRSEVVENGQNFPQENPQENPNEIPKRAHPENVDIPRGEGTLEKHDSPRESQEIPQGIPHTRTSSNNNNINNKELKDSCRSQLRNKDDLENFVDSQMQINPMNLPKRLIAEYLNTIRLQRSTGIIAVSVVKKIWDKLVDYSQKLKYTPDESWEIISYALMLHKLEYDSKPENYTYGIIRRTTIHEARQGMIRMINRKKAATGTEGGSHGNGSRSRPAFENTDAYDHLF